MTIFNHGHTRRYRTYGKLHTIKIKLSAAAYEKDDHKRNKHEQYKSIH